MSERQLLLARLSKENEELRKLLRKHAQQYVDMQILLQNLIDNIDNINKDK